MHGGLAKRWCNQFYSRRRESTPDGPLPRDLPTGVSCAPSQISLSGMLTVSADVVLQAGRAASLSSGTLQLLPLEHLGALDFLAGPVPVTLSLASTLQVVGS